MKVSTELRDIVISVLVLSFAFYNALGIDIFTALITISLVFLLHELAHRYVARRYGCFAEFKIWTWGILLALVSSFAGFIFAAPGAVYISPYKRDSAFAFSVAHLTKKEYGKISLSGPITNIAIGLAALLLSFIFSFQIFPIIFRISFFLAFFNMLPIPPLDGSKVFAWSWKVWIAAFAVCVLALFL